MATKSRADLIQRVLEELKVTGEGQPASAEDVDVVEKRIDSSIAYLEATNVISLPTDEFEDTYFEPLVVYMAAMCGRPFSVPVTPEDLDRTMDPLRTIARINRGTGRKLAVDQGLRFRSWGRLYSWDLW